MSTFTYNSDTYLINKGSSTFTVSATGVYIETGDTVTTSFQVTGNTAITTSVLSATTSSSPYDSSTTTMQVSISSSTYKLPVCKPSGSSFASNIQSMSASVYNVRQYYLYSTYTAGTLYPTARAEMYFLPFGFISSQKYAFSGMQWSSTIPLSKADLAYKFSFTYSVTCTTGTCSVSNSVLKTTFTGTYSDITINAQYNGASYYSKFRITKVADTSPTISSISNFASVKNTLIKLELPFTDSVYGTSCLDSHSLTITSTNTDDMFIDSLTRPPKLYWAGTSTSTLTYKVTNSGGYTSSYTFTYNVNDAPTFTKNPKIEGWSTCKVSYTPEYTDPENDSIVISASTGVVSGTKVTWPDFTYKSSIITISDGYNSASQTVSLYEINYPIVINNTIVCIIDRICFLTYSSLFSIDTQIASFGSSNDNIIFGEKIYITPTSLNPLYESITLMSTFECVFSFDLNILVFSEILINIESVYCKSNDLFKVSLGEEGFEIENCEFSPVGSEMEGLCEDGLHFCKFISEDLSGNQGFGTSRVEKPEFIEISNVYYGKTWNGCLKIEDCDIGDCYYNMSEVTNFTLHPVTAIVQFLDPYETNFILTVEKSGFEFTKSYIITPKNSIEIGQVNQTNLYGIENSSLEETIKVIYNKSYTLAISPAEEFISDTILFSNCTESRDYTLDVNGSDNDYSMLLYLSILKSVTPYLPSNLDETDLRCITGEVLRINIVKCKNYVDLKTYNELNEFKSSDNETVLFLVQSPFDKVGDFAVLTPNISDSYNLTVIASYSTYGSIQQLYTINCFTELVLYLKPQNLIYGQVYSDKINITRDSVEVSNIKYLWIYRDKPATMTADLQGNINWVVDLNGPIILNLLIYVETAEIPSSNKTFEVALNISYHERPEIKKSIFDFYCYIPLSAPRSVCTSEKKITELATVNCPNPECAFSLGTNDPDIRIDENEMIVWNRTYIDESKLNDTSASIEIIITDNSSSTSRSNKFYFIPNFIAEILELGYIDDTNNFSLYKALNGCNWDRKVRIQDWTYLYPDNEQISDSQVELIIGSETVDFSRGLIKWTPNSLSTHLGSITYTDPIGNTVQKEFNVSVVEATNLTCSYVQSSIIYNKNAIQMNLNDYCTYSEDYDNIYTAVKKPENSEIEDSVFYWVPETIGKYSISVKVSSSASCAYFIFNFDLIIQEALNFEISKETCEFGVELWAFIKLTSSCENMPMSMIALTLNYSTSPEVVLSKTGELYWSNPTSDLNITVKADLDGSYYLTETNFFNFTILLQDSLLWMHTIPLLDSNKFIIVNNTWSVEFYCTSNRGLAYITLSDLKYASHSYIDESWLKITWTPTINNFEVETITIYCQDTVKKIEYNIVVVPQFSEEGKVWCSDFIVNVEYGKIANGAVDWKSSKFDFGVHNVTCDYLKGLDCYHLGYFEFLLSELPNNPTFGVEIDGVRHCNGTLNFISKPILSDISNQICDSLSTNCTLLIPVVLIVGSIESSQLNTTNSLSLISNESIQWTPGEDYSADYASLSVSNSFGSDETPFFLCHGPKCRVDPVIDSISGDSSCTNLNFLVKCPLFKPVEIELTISGKYFRTQEFSSLYIGDQVATTIEWNETNIKFLLPIPSFQESALVTVYLKVSSDGTDFYYSTGYRIIEYEYPYTPVISLSAHYLVFSKDSTFNIDFSSDFLLDLCTCFIDSIQGTLNYLGLGSQCSTNSLSADSHTLHICCLGQCSNTVSFTSISNVSFTPNITEGHNHGGYGIQVNLEYSGDLGDNLIYFAFNNFIIKSAPYCENTMSCTHTFIIPLYSSCQSAEISLGLSLNTGRDFLYYSSSPTFKYTGCCTLGSYLNLNLCAPCPKGFYCDLDLSKSSSLYFSTPLPCPLGSYSESLGSYACKLCPIGSQCYCIGTISPELCEAGYYCSDQGTTRRRNPCPKGRFCPQGTTTTPSLCQAGYYCVYGIYTNTPDPDNSYTPQPCIVASSCVAGSTNEYGAIDCEIGYYCPETDLIKEKFNCYDSICACPTGYYCPTSQLKAPILCSPGQYQSFIKQSKCEICPEGYYCPNTNPPNEKIICSEGHYCLTSSTRKAACALGTYQDKPGKSSCLSCEPGTYQPKTGQTGCVTCSAGFICASSGMAAQEPCTSGFYCLEGTNRIASTCQEFENTDSTIYPIPCPIYNYCPVKSKSAKVCKFGFYSNNKCQGECLPCEKGFICVVEGKQTICPAGYFCINNQKYSCPAGYYCLEGTTTGKIDSSIESSPKPCNPGTYCSLQNVSPIPDDSLSGAAQECGAGTYNDEYAQTVCKKCPDGYQCPSAGMKEPELCEKGTYRNVNSSSLYCLECPEGTYNNLTGRDSSDFCLNCQAGVVCVGAGMAYPNGENSFDCPAGYYCPEGTGLASSNKYPCPEGTFCLSGTKSEEEARMNKCPSGRYCAKGTGSTATSCESATNCTIGSICSIGFYCPSGTESMISCPQWASSNSGSLKKTECFRSSQKSSFYKTELITQLRVLENIKIPSLGLKRFKVDLNSNNEDKITIDYQIMIEIQVLNEIKRILILTCDDYEPKTSVPLPYSQVFSLDQAKELFIEVSANYEVVVDFVVQFFNGSSFVEPGQRRLVLSNFLEVIEEFSVSEGFLAVITKDTGELFEDPINYYYPSLVSESGNLEKERYFENDFYTSTITETTLPTWEDTVASQNTTSFWTDRKDPLYLSYLPYITSCSPGYGSFISISHIMNSDTCKSGEIQGLSYLPKHLKASGKTCKVALNCFYEVDLFYLNRKKRWYEAINSLYKTKKSSYDEYPPFYITRKPLNVKQNFGDLVEDELVPVKASRKASRAWVQGEVPKKVRLTFEYYLNLNEDIEILRAGIEFSEFTEDLNDTRYELEFNLQLLTWLECFDLHAFSFTEYLLLIIYTTLMYLLTLIFFTCVSRFIKPVSKAFPSFLTGFTLIFNSFKGFFLAFPPICSAFSAIFCVLYFVDYFKYQTGNFEDTSVIKDLDSTNVKLYLTSRMGTCYLFLGLLLMKQGTDLIIPATVYTGFSYETQTLQYKELLLLPKKQGYVIGSVVFVGFLSTLLDSLGQIPFFQDFYYLIFPFLLIFEYLFKVVLIWLFENDLETLPARISLKISIFLMILNTSQFHICLILFYSVLYWNFIYTAFFEHLHCNFVFSYFKKSIEKRQMTSNPTSNNFSYACSELSERSLILLSNLISLTLTVYFYFMYDFYTYSFPINYFLYLIFLQCICLLYQIPGELLVEYVRITRDTDYSVPEVLQRSTANYKQRLCRWALSIVKIHDAAVSLSPISTVVFMSAWSSQLFFTLTFFCYGVFFFCHSVKLWRISTNNPFLDYWTVVFGIMTFASFFIVKILFRSIGKLVFWRIPILNQLFVIGIDGKAIKNRDEFIGDAILREKIKSSGKEKLNFSVVDLGEKLLDTIKNNENLKEIKEMVAAEFRDQGIFDRMNAIDLFKDFKNRIDAINDKKFEERIKRVIEPNKKIELINAKMLKRMETFPDYPAELIYNWDEEAKIS